MQLDPVRCSTQLRLVSKATDGLTVQTFNFQENFGAGEGIRTLDPDLGKVVLYP
jgi:hypothetical protein